MRKTMTVLTVLVVVALALSGCDSSARPVARPTTPEPEPAITQEEAEALLQPVFTAAHGGWRQAERSAVESATLAAFALKDSFMHDVEPLATTLAELDLKHTIGSEPPQMEMRYDGLGSRMAEGLQQTLTAVAEGDDASLFEVAWSFPPEAGVEGGPDYTTEQETLAQLLGEYLAPCEAASLDAIEYSVEPSNTIVVTYRYAEARSAESSSDTVWTVRYLAEQRDGDWKVVGLADVAYMLKDRDDAAIALYEERARQEREQQEKDADANRDTPTQAEVERVIKTETPHATITRIGPPVITSTGDWWVEAECETQGAENTHMDGWGVLLVRHNGEWDFLGDTITSDRTYDRTILPSEAVSALESIGVKFWTPR